MICSAEISFPSLSYNIFYVTFIPFLILTLSLTLFNPVQFLPFPWNISPAYVSEKVKVLVAQSCLTLWNSVDCSLPASSVCGILQARIVEWVAIPFSRGSSWPRGQTQVSCIAGRFFTIWATSPLSLKSSLSFNHTNDSACNTDSSMAWAVLILPFWSSITLGNLLKLTEYPFPHLKSMVYNTHFISKLSWVLEMFYIKKLESDVY